MVDENIMTKHPLGKRGLINSKRNYETVKQAILKALRKAEMTHTELVDQLKTDLKGKFTGNISWYAVTVKLDLEARQMIERTPTKPQKYLLK